MWTILLLYSQNLAMLNASLMKSPQTLFLKLAAFLVFAVGALFAFSTHAATIIVSQLDGTILAGVGGDSGGLGASQTFVAPIAARVGSLEIFTANFGTNSRNPDTNACSVSISDDETGAFLASADNGFNGFGCAGDLLFTFNNAQPLLQAGHRYRWNFGLSGFSPSLSFAGSAADTVQGSFSAPAIANAEFILRASLPLPTNLAQFKSNGATPIPEGTSTFETTVVLSGIPKPSADAASDTLELQAEVKPIAIPFSDIPNLSTLPADTGVTIAKAVTGLAGNTDYHWQARAFDPTSGAASPWEEFGTPGNTDFIIPQILVQASTTILLDASTSFTASDGPIPTGPTVMTPGQVFYHGPSAFNIQAIQVDDHDGSSNNHDGFGNIQAQIFDLSGNLIATSTNTIYGESGCTGCVFSFSNELIPQDFKLQLFIEDGIQGDGAFSVNNVRFETASPAEKTIKVAVILAEPFGESHEAQPITAQPCKLIPQKLYISGHDMEYFQNLASCVTDYHIENSYGAINLQFTIFDNGGRWYKITDPAKTYAFYANGQEKQFVGDAIALASSTGANLEGFDVVAAVHSGPFTLTVDQQQSLMETETFIEPSSLRINLSEDDGVGGWAHEIGHDLGALLAPENTPVPDLVNMGNVEQWDLMARGSRNSGGNDPPQMSSYTKEFLHFLNYDILPDSFLGIVNVTTLTDQKFGDKALRYNLANTAQDDNTTPYYILESRNNQVGVWDSSIPASSSAVIYYVDPRGFPEYGVSQGVFGSYLNNGCRIVNIPDSSQESGILKNVGDSYSDYHSLVRFTFVASTSASDAIQISPINSAALPGAFREAVLMTNGELGRLTCQFFGNNLIRNPLNPVPGAPIVTFPVPGSDFVTMRWQLRKEWINFEGDIPIAFGILIVLLILIYWFYWYIIRKQNKKNILRPTKWKIVLFLITGIIAIALPKQWITVSGQIVDVFLPNFLFDALIWYLLACLAGDIAANIGSRAKRWIFVVIYAFGFAVLAIAGYLWRLGPNPGLLKLDSGIPPASTAEINADNSANIPRIENALGGSILPDLDLHAITPDGRRVGMNYATGQYENQISGAIASGDNQDSPEWILVPDGIQAQFFVTSKDNQDFLNANPGIASQLPTTTDSYDIYSRYIDPVNGIFTSPTISNQTIAPGATSSPYIVNGTTTPLLLQSTTSTFNASADTYLKQSDPNRNFGTDTELRIEPGGNIRAGVIQFNQNQLLAAIGPSSTILSAKLQMTIVGNGGGWGSGGEIDLSRLTRNWTENGATWNCPVDTDTANSNLDCPSGTWSIAGPTFPFNITPIATSSINNMSSGVISFDVTNDVQSFIRGINPNDGWIIKEHQGNDGGSIDFDSGETANPPVLVVTFGR